MKRQEFTARFRIKNLGAEDFWKKLLAIFLFGLIYFASAKLGLALAFVHPSATAVWPPAGIALAALLLFGYQLWPAIFLGALFANLTTAGSVWTSLGIATGNTLEAVLGAFLVSRFAGGSRAFERPQDVLKFGALAGLLSTAVSASLGVTSLYLGGFVTPAEYGQVWFTWWLGDMGGVTIVAPLVILWVANPRLPTSGLKLGEFLVALALLVVVGYLAFASFPAENLFTASVAFMTIPILLWTAVRLDRRDASTAVFLICAIAVWGTLHGYGPFFRVDRNESLILLQEIGGMIAVMVLMLSAAIYSRNRTEQALRASEHAARRHLAELETIYRTAPAGLGLTDRALRFMNVNETLAEIDGIPASAHMGRSLREIVPESLADTLEPLYRRVIETGEPIVNLEVQGETKARPGIQRIWSVNYHPVRDADESVIGVSVMVQEITDRKHSERRRQAHFAITQILAESPSLHEATPRILRTIGDTLGWEVGALWIPDGEANVLRCWTSWHEPSAAVDKFISASYEHAFAPGIGLPGRVWTHLKPAWISDATRDSNFPRAPFAIAAGLHTGFAFPILFHDKLLGVMEFFSRHVRESDEALLALFENIGSQVGQFMERKQTEEALRESEERFRSTFENAAIGMAHVGLDGRWLRVNRTLCEITGYSHEELLAKTFGDVTYPDDLETSWASVHKLLAGELPTYSMEKRYVRKDGSLVWVEITVSLRRDAEGRPLYFIGAVEDISERKKAQEDLHEADRRKDEFLAMLGHELRNPLGIIGNAVQILRHLDSSDPNLQELREMIERQVIHTSRLLDDLLDVSRISRGKLQIDKRPCDLREIARQTAADYRSALADAGLALDIDVGDEPVPVNGDPTRLAQAVGNLLHNACKFTPPGGRVKVHLRSDGRVNAVLEVGDTGRGFEPEAIEWIFEPFSQADRSLDRSHGGLGLGLALVKAIVELHDGEVTAASQGPQQGATFTLRLPLDQTQLIAPAPREAATNSANSSRILIVEDNTVGARSMRMLLELMGHTVAVAHNGAEAMAAAAAFKPDIVLCDIGLPGVNGYEVARALRQEAGLEGAYLIGISGYAPDEQRAREAGFHAHMTKPVDFAKLEEILAQSSAQRRNNIAPRVMI